jgi:hypothetical protein
MRRHRRLISLSLSLSRPCSALGLTAKTRQVCSPLGGRVSHDPGACAPTKLPCHARGDVRRPHAVTRDRSLACNVTNGRQAHCEWVCRAPGGVAGLQPTSLQPSSFLHSAPSYPALRPGRVSHDPGACAPTKLPCHAHGDVRRPNAVTRDRSLACNATNGRQAHCEWVCRAPGGVAGLQRHISPAPRAGVHGVRRAPGGVAGLQPTSFSPRAPSHPARRGVCVGRHCAWVCRAGRAA